MMASGVTCPFRFRTVCEIRLIFKWWDRIGVLLVTVVAMTLHYFYVLAHASFDFLKIKCLTFDKNFRRPILA